MSKIIDLLPSEKQSMTRVVCDDLARLTYDGSSDNFVSRLICLQELADDWAKHDGIDLYPAVNSHDDGNVTGCEDSSVFCDVSMVCDEIPHPSFEPTSSTTSKRGRGGYGRGRGRPSAIVGSSKPVPHRVQLLAKKRRMVPEVTVLCAECGKSFRYAACLQRHLRIVHGSKKTEFTGNSSSLLGLDEQLEREAENMTSFECTECPKSCMTLSELCWHVRVHNMRSLAGFVSSNSSADTVPAEFGTRDTTEEYMCSVCDRRFNTGHELMMHAAENAEAHECPDCGRRMESAFYLRVHRLIHKPMKTVKEKTPKKWTSGPVNCAHCDAQFKTYSGYQDHLATTHGAKKFICDICARQCSRRSQLTRHLLTHGGERRFECGKCGRRFLLREMLRRHVRAVHVRLRPHLCNLCGRPFAEKHQLNTHMKVHRR